MTTIITGRYCSSARVIPAPETPINSNIGGNQQQLDATIADTTVPILAISSPRPLAIAAPPLPAAAPGSALPPAVQQSGAGVVAGCLSLDIVRSSFTS